MQANQQSATLSTDQAETIQHITIEFGKNLPQAAVTAGKYEAAQAEEEGLVIQPASGVPDGRYRVEGHDWIITVAGEQTVLFERGGPSTDPATVTSVPAPLNLPGARPY